MLRLILLAIPVLLIASVVMLSKTFGGKEPESTPSSSSTPSSIQAPAKNDTFHLRRFVEIRGYWLNGEDGFVHTDEGRFHIGKPARLGGQDVYLVGIDPQNQLLHVHTDKVEVWPFIVISLPLEKIEIVQASEGHLPNTRQNPISPE